MLATALTILFRFHREREHPRFGRYDNVHNRRRQAFR